MYFSPEVTSNKNVFVLVQTRVAVTVSLNSRQCWHLLLLSPAYPHILFQCMLSKCLSPKYISVLCLLGCGHVYLFYVCTFDVIARLLVNNQLALNAVMQVWHPIISLFSFKLVSWPQLSCIKRLLYQNIYQLCFPSVIHIFLHNILSKIVNLIYIIRLYLYSVFCCFQISSCSCTLLERRFSVHAHLKQRTETHLPNSTIVFSFYSFYSLFICLIYKVKTMQSFLFYIWLVYSISVVLFTSVW